MRTANLLTFLLTIVQFCLSVRSSSSSPSLYEILGVKKDATTKQLKSAYRKRALETHPDKNPGNEEQAAKDFIEVVDAFEILTDPNARKTYDSTGQARSGRAGRTYGEFDKSGFQAAFANWFRGEHGVAWETVNEVQARVLHLLDPQQIRDVLLTEDDNRLEQDTLLIFVTTEDMDRLQLVTILFPYPFSKMQAVKVLLHQTSHRREILNLFGSPTRITQPLIFFGKEGEDLETMSQRSFATSKRREFESWVQDNLNANVTFHNDHDHDVDVYWWLGDASQPQKLVQLEPGQEQRFETKKYHTFYIRDIRVDAFEGAPQQMLLLNHASSIMVHEVQKYNQIVSIPPLGCFDLSAHCAQWPCDTNEQFMHQYCQKTCNTCKHSEMTTIKEEL